MIVYPLVSAFFLWCEEWHFNIYYFSDWGTIVSWTWRTTSQSSLASRLFSQKTRHRHKNYNHDEDIFPTTAPLWKQQRSNETSTMLSRTALYSILFRLICTAIATPLRSETYRALHHRIRSTIFTSHRPSHHIYTFPFVDVLIKQYFYKQTIYGGSRFAASK